MRKLILICGLALLGCTEDKRSPCMSPTESGTVTAVNTTNHKYCGRGGCTNTPFTTINVTMTNGVARICDASYVTADMLIVGQRINISNAKRAL